MPMIDTSIKSYSMKLALIQCRIRRTKMAPNQTSLLASQAGSIFGVFRLLPLLKDKCTLYRLPPEIRIIIIDLVLEEWYEWDGSIKDISPDIANAIPLNRVPFLERAVIPCKTLFREVMNCRIQSSVLTLMPDRIRHFDNVINHTEVFGYQYPTLAKMSPLATRSIRKVSLHTQFVTQVKNVVDFLTPPRNATGGGAAFEDTLSSMARLLSKASLPLFTCHDGS
jgi:hypothetical protein